MNFKIIKLNGLKNISRNYFCLLILFSFLIIFSVPRLFSREPTPAELESIREETRVVFENFLQLWQEERYFELYRYGKKYSLDQITLEEFATRMVELDWVPVGLANKNKPKISYRYKTLLYVNAAIVFQHKNYLDLQFTRQQSFLLIKENGNWRFDLIQMIRSPFYSPVK